METNVDAAALLNVVSDAVIAVDREGKLIFWNPAAERIFGYRADEALGNSLDLIIPERKRGRHWTGFNHVMETGQTRLGTEVLYAPAHAKDGHEFRIALTVGILRGADQETITAIAAIIRPDKAPT